MNFVGGQAQELSQAEITKAAMNEKSDPFSEFNDEVQLTSEISHFSL